MRVRGVRRGVRAFVLGEVDFENLFFMSSIRPDHTYAADLLAKALPGFLCASSEIR